MLHTFNSGEEIIIINIIIIIMLFVCGMEIGRAQYNVKHYGKHEILLLDKYFLYNYFPTQSGVK